MTRLFPAAFAALLALASAGAATAADLIVENPAPAAADAASSIYAKLFAGVALQDALEWNGIEYDLDAGAIIGGAIGFGLGVPGLSAELEITGSSAYYTGYDNSLDAVTLMGNLVYAAPINDIFALYGGAGLGVALVNYNNELDIYDADGSAATGQVFAGVEAEVADGISLFTEARYQLALSDVSVTNGNGYTYDVEFSRASVSAGLKFAF